MRPKPVTPEVELPAPADESTIAPKRTTASRRRDNDRQRGSADWAPLLELSREAVRAGLSAGGYEGAAIDGAEQDFFDWIEPHAHSSRPGQGFRPWLVERLEQFLTEHPAIETSTDAGTDSVAEATCPVCGAAAAVRLENGECGGCWFSLVRFPRAERMPQHVGDYAIVEKLGSGGESSVYRARRRGNERDVALKILRADMQSEPQLVERFRETAWLVSKLEHPRIVRVGDLEGLGAERPFYTMALIDGGTLADRVEAFRDPERAARLVIRVARAVQYAHEHGVLHRDLKPRNVLLDSDGQPYLTDFMAQPIARGSTTSVGTYNYMAWEQAAGRGSVVATDVYGLGAILYELITGRPPLEANSIGEVKDLHEQKALVPPRHLVRSLDRGLDAVCRAALSKDPAARHRSAALFADSLERVLGGHAPLFPEPSRRQRLWLWCRRHPLLAAVALIGLVAVLLADLATFHSVRAERSELITGAMRNNTALASAQARAVTTVFDQYIEQVARAALDPAVQELAARGVPTLSAPVLRELVDRARGVDSMAVFDQSARILARYPTPPDGYLGRAYEFRDYYRCARARVLELDRRAAYDSLQPIEGRACLSPAYRGEISQAMEFAVSAPVFDGSHRWVGIVVMTRHANRTLGDIEIDDPYGSGQATILFGWRGRDRGEASPQVKRTLTVVAHPALYTTQEFGVPPALSDRLISQLGMGDGRRVRALRSLRWEEPDYFDPVDKQYKVAGFAPVGVTGYVVGVTTPRERALGANQRHIDSLLQSMALLNLGFLLVALAGVGATLRERQVPTRRDD